MAMGVLEYLHEHNYGIPEDVAVLGYDNLQISETSTPPLSTVGLPIHDLAETTINHLINLIENPGQEPKQFVFECELKIRKSA
jgi:LacI family transcriptional regulator